MRLMTKLGVVVCSLIGFHSMIALADDTAKIRSTLQQNFPNLTIDEIKPTPIHDLFQVTAGGTVLYVTADGHYAFSGDMVDLQNSQNNLTEIARKTARIKGLKAIGEENMVVFPAKNHKYTVSVFTDVDCGYCRKLQNEIPKLNDLGITVRYLAFPRSGPNSPTAEKMLKVWCAKDKRQAMIQANLDKSIDSKTCDTHNIAKEFQFGLMVGVTGTPTLLFEDGTLVPGYLSPDKMLEVAEQVHENKPVKAE